jgi:uncharacterized membrane protein YdjX (TVP38/TMEM64 family)
MGRTWTRRVLAGAVLLLALLAVWQVRAHAGATLQHFAAWVDGLGAGAPIAFVAGYALAVVAFVPGSLLTLAGGAIFGPVAGTAFVFAAATLGACAAFLIARYAARGWVARRIAASPRFDALDRAIAGEGLRVVFLLRLSPVFPFNLLNYALGLTRVRFTDYALASVGMLPATLAYVYLGSLIGDLAGLDAAAAAPEGTRWLRHGLSALGVAATLAASGVIARIARRALAQATGEGERPSSV